MKPIHMLSHKALPRESAFRVSGFDEKGFVTRLLDSWRSGLINHSRVQGSSGDIEVGKSQAAGIHQFEAKPYLAVEIAKEAFKNQGALALKAQDR
jgi:hypothetical protein